MEPYPQGFPFGIRDVAELLHLKVRRRQADSMYTDCPFCGDRRGKMNVNFAKDVWRCNYCGESGGMLSLYARLNNTTNSDAYREICDALLAGDTTWGYDGWERNGKSCGGYDPESQAYPQGEGSGHQPVRAEAQKGQEIPATQTDAWKEPGLLQAHAVAWEEQNFRVAQTNVLKEGTVLQAEHADARQIHQTYSLLLGMLNLTPAHRAHLKSEKRGLTDSQIDSFGFKSTPPCFLCRSLTERLLKQGCTVEGVPGFYLHGNGYWTVRFSSRTSGILIPAIGIDGLIRGMQILLDAPFKDKDDPPEKAGTKYIWLSSASKNRGVTSGSPVHFAGNPFSRTIYVTEGLLKADIAHCLTDRSFAAVAGANNVKPLEPLFALLAQNGTELVIEAHDMDKYSNEMTARGSSQICRMARQYGMECRRLTWDPNYKGIDDWQLALRREKRKAKGDREDSGKKSFKERYLLGQCGMDGLKPEMESMRREMQPEQPDTKPGRDGGSRAAESLGLTAEEYAVFCHDGAEALERMLDAQKQRCCFKLYQLALDGGETVPFAFKGILELYRAGYEQPPAAKYKLAADTALVCPDRWKDAEILKHISVCLGGDISEKDGSCMEHPLAPSDVVELKDETGRRYFYVDGAGFEPVRFSPFLAKPMDEQGQDKGASDVRGCLKK